MQTKLNFTEEQETEFIKSLYDNCNEELKKIYDLQNENKDKLLKELALVLLLYTINNNILDLTRSEKEEIKAKFEKIIVKSTNKQIKLTTDVITLILINTIKDTFKFYEYTNYTKKDIENIVHRKYKGEVYTNRIEKNEKDIANYLNKKIKSFTEGDIDVNNIHEEIEKTYRQAKTNVLVLAETETNRTENDGFVLYAESLGATKFVRNEILDSRTCDECAGMDGNIYDIKDIFETVHPSCRGYNTLIGLM